MTTTPIMLKNANDNIPRTEQDREIIIEKATKAYEVFLKELGFDWKSDPNSQDTPKRVAKSYVNDLMRGCFEPPPKITAFPNDGHYDGLVCQTNIKCHSLCSHHHLPFIGVAHVAYVPHKNGKVIGLSKINRIVEWFARRPQIQEGLTMQIHDAINFYCELNRGVAVMIEAKHTCACLRGVKHDSIMMTTKMSGCFHKDQSRDEFYNYVKFAKKGL